MKRMQYAILVFCLMTSCSNNLLKELSFLEGSWQVENENQFEKWEIDTDKNLTGSGYKLIDGDIQIFETLSITEMEKQIVYNATVTDQNEGSTIPFALNENIKDLFSFENLIHDFPQKIQYKKISNERIKVSVLGKDNKGFSFFMNKIKNFQNSKN